MTTSQHSISPFSLPPNWVPDETLKAELQTHGLDYRNFRRIQAAPDRYAVNITGTAPHIWDLHLSRPVSPTTPGSRGKNKAKASHPRLRFRLNLGAMVGAKWFFLSRLVCQAIHGPPPLAKSEAHHADGNVQNNDWRNLHWLSPQANRAIERIRPERMRTQRPGSKNSNAKLPSIQLFRLIRDFDDQQTSERDLAARYNLSPAQAHRLVTGESRADEVKAIRWRLAGYQIQNQQTNLPQTNEQ
ncbi:HNH endonuclease [Falsiroseomonas sp.]|uniref:HNH endonuclease n=1 Tax=Falsiroseomonas sp. TaxID=2870721 RepID=UPI00351F4A33